jgi:receptor protein-tyrosine kinase
VTVPATSGLVAERVSEPSPVAVDRQFGVLSEVTESFRSIRTRLLLEARSGARSFLITSATPSEGKSTVAASLACALASVRRSVLLIDADLRRPRQHELFDLPNRSGGLTSVLKGIRPPADVWQSTGKGPTVLTSGLPTRDPQHLLQSERFSAVLSAARERFEFILIDTTPVLAVEDACLLASQVDRTILVVKYAAVSEADAREAVERLHSARATIAGCVMNQMTDARERYHTYGADYVNPYR